MSAFALNPLFSADGTSDLENRPDWSLFCFSHLPTSLMFCCCLRNSLGKLQTLETDLCSTSLPNQEENPQLPASKDPVPSAALAGVQVDADTGGGKSVFVHKPPWISFASPWKGDSAGYSLTAYIVDSMEGMHKERSWGKHWEEKGWWKCKSETE